ncbi:MAG TPA: AmmeMemoRadiSam system radical SAM enzyme [Candidatus Atribacteria bacterium]|nr:AmmeMemoRadiSam system radical SAM enzyme [Candidatus Atribacteria bacterium]
MKVQARFYEKLKDKVHCFLCPHNCVIEKEGFGKCRVRINEGGDLYVINYGEITSLALDPIEKKPLHYFRPGTFILSAGTFGCNFTCGFCQNYEISQSRPPSESLTKEQLVQIILKTDSNTGIAFTYNEPAIWYEYVYDCARLLKKTDGRYAVVLVTNGYISEEPLKELLPYVDAMNIDLKGFSDDFYKRLCGGRLKPVLRTIETAIQASCHVEITTLLVSGQNDTLAEVERIAGYLGAIDKDIPLHLSRYFPRYKFKSPPTDIGFMREAEKAARKHLNRVLLGNV